VITSEGNPAKRGRQGNERSEAPGFSVRCFAATNNQPKRRRGYPMAPSVDTEGCYENFFHALCMATPSASPIADQDAPSRLAAATASRSSTSIANSRRLTSDTLWRRCTVLATLKFCGLMRVAITEL